MANCPTCASPIEAGDAFCSSCGAKTPQAAPTPQPEVTAPAPAPSSVAQAYVAPLQPNYVAPRPLVNRDVVKTVKQLSTNGWLLCGGAAAMVIGSLLPWSSISDGQGDTASGNPKSGGTVIILILAAAALAVAWPSIQSALSKRRLAGLTLVLAVLVIIAAVNWSDLGKLQNQANAGNRTVNALIPGLAPNVTVSAGGGIILFTAGVVLLGVLVVRLVLARRRQLTATG